MTDSDLTTLLREHRWSTIKWGCHCGHPGDLPSHYGHVSSVLSGVYAITPLPEKPRRKYTAAYRAENGNIIPVGAENIHPEYVAGDLADWRRDDPEGTYFLAHRDVPSWQVAPE